MSKYERREEVPERYRWDATVLFENRDDWDAALDRYADAVEELSIPEDVATDADALLGALERRDELRHLDARLWIYAQCQAWTDVTDEEAQGMVRRVKRITNERDAVFEELERAVRDADAEQVESLLAERSELARYEHFLTDIRQQGTDAPEPVVEETLAELSETLDAPGRLFRTIVDRSVDYPAVTDPDGEEVTLRRPAHRAAMAHPDREYRRRTYEAYRDALREEREAMAAAYVEHVRSHVSQARVRNDESTLAASLDGQLPPTVHETLVESLREHSAPFARRFERLRERRDLSELRPWDRRAPISDAEEPEIPYDDAVEIVADAVAPLGDDYKERLADLLDGRRVDVYPTEHKRGVHAAHFGADGVDSFVFLNYGEDLESLYFFVHELGHAMHYLLARDAQPAVYGNISWHVAEVASFLHEVLLTDYLLDADVAPDGAVLDVALRKLPILTAARHSAFERRVVDAVEADEDLAADDLDAIYREEERSFFEPIAFGEDDGFTWQNQHLDRDPFTGHLYLLGTTGALSVARGLRTGDLDAETYRAFLRAGDSESPMELLETLDLDVASGGVVETAAAEYGRFVDAIPA